MSDTLKADNAADSGLLGTTCCPLPGQPGYVDHMRERNRREGIEPESYRAPLKIAGFVTAGWLEGQARDAEANGHAFVGEGLACAADAWFALANAYRIEATLLFSDNAESIHPESKP
jgi:hypothetical protein